MTEWAPKRFYKDATVDAEGDGFSVRLDGRPVRTPGKRLLTLPTERMAEAVAAEWRAQDQKIDPRTMPWTRSANTALDKVSTQRSEIVAHLAGYAGTDLLFYRAEAPEELVARQARLWDPILCWAQDRHDAGFKIVSGVMPVDQDDEIVKRLCCEMDGMSDFHLTGFHDLVALSGSFLIGLATVRSVQEPGALWRASRADEDWQAEVWGLDEEAAEVAALKQDAFLHSLQFYLAA